MCGRFAFHASSEELAKGLGIKMWGLREERRYNIAPGQWIIVVRPEKSERVASLARWGLVPSWAKDPEVGPQPINARADGVAIKPTFRGAFRHGRCLIPASGFYEWQTHGKTKVPHYIRPKVGGIFVFAGLLENWHDELQTCAIVTTEPNSLMAGIHNRMPVILDPDAAAAWLDPKNRHPEDLLVPFASEAMEAYPVNSSVGNARNDGPELIRRVE